MIFQVVAQFEVYVKAKLGVIPSGAVLQAEGGISRVPNPHFAARNTPRPLVNASLRDASPGNQKIKIEPLPYSSSLAEPAAIFKKR
jgi:hypothetical protein